MDVITYTNCDMNVCSKPVIMKYICENTLKHINKNNWTLYGNFDIKLVSFPGSPVSFSKLKIFQSSPLGLLVPAVVRGHTQDRYRDTTFALEKAALEV